MGQRWNKDLQLPRDSDFRRTYKAAWMDAGEMAPEAFALELEMDRGQGP